MREAKQEIRQTILKQRAEFDPKSRETAEANLIANLIDYSFVHMASHIAVYRAIRGEVNLDPAIADFHNTGTVLAVPRVVGNDLEFVRWVPGTLEAPGAFGIPEPLSGEVEDLRRYRIVLLPMVAFDSSGHRLGYGKGFYDRAIAALGNSRPLLIGIAFDFQEVPSLPVDSWDIRLDGVVTNSRLISFGSEELY